MPFHEMSKDDLRRVLACRVLLEGIPLAQAARESGVSRTTAHLWVERARKDGIADLSERSRRPHHLPAATEVVAPEVVQRILECKAEHPRWGAKKLHRCLWPQLEGNSASTEEGAEGVVCVRTVHRVLARHGLVGLGGERLDRVEERDCSVPNVSGVPCRFERATCNELWQADYKGLGKGASKALDKGNMGSIGKSGGNLRGDQAPPPCPLSILDDCSRFCLWLAPAPAKTGACAWDALWSAFGEFGLPECLLTDNGDGFHNARSAGPSWLEARLWRLGVSTTHGRPYHPQTQGKVERFHRSLQEEVGSSGLRCADALSAFRQRYNWERPHEALDMRVPGSVYQASVRRRPDRLPEHTWAEGATVRKVDEFGKFSWKGREYRAGRGLAGEYVEIREELREELQEEIPEEPEKPGGRSAGRHAAGGTGFGYGAVYAGRRFAALNDLAT